MTGFIVNPSRRSQQIEYKKTNGKKICLIMFFTTMKNGFDTSLNNFNLNKYSTAGNSVHQTAQYERLAQEPSDNEEEDDVLFKREALAKQNGHPQEAQNGVAGESIEMVNADKTASNKSDSLTAEELNIVKFKVVKRATALWRTRVSCFVLLLVLVLLLGLTLAFIVPYFRNVEKVTIHHIRTTGWNKTYEDAGEVHQKLMMYAQDEVVFFLKENESKLSVDAV